MTSMVDEPGVNSASTACAASTADVVGIVGPAGLAVIEAARRWRESRESGGMLFHNACRALADAVDHLNLRQ